MAKYLWAISKKSDASWIKWIHTYVIKSHSLWSMKCPSNVSWSIRKILHLRPLMQEWIKYVVGNGASVFLWTDNWHTLGPLLHKYQDQIVFNMGRSLNARVASIVCATGWRWARVRNPVVQDIIAHTPVGFLPNMLQDDSVRWTLTATGTFNLRASGSKVDWRKVVWFKHHVPRWAVIQWMIVLGRLSTRNRLVSGGLLQILAVVCVLMGSKRMSISFFIAFFSSGIWCYFLGKNGVQRAVLSLR